MFQTLYFPEGFRIGRRLTSCKRGGIIDDDRAIILPDRDQRVAAVAGEFGMGHGLAWRGVERLDDLERLLVDDVHLVLVGPEEDIGPDIGRELVAAQEKARAIHLDRLDQLPGVNVDDGEHSLPSDAASPSRGGPSRSR